MLLCVKSNKRVTTVMSDHGDYQPMFYDNQTGESVPPISAGGVTDHGSLTGLDVDDHAQYALLLGRGGTQALKIGTLTLASGATVDEIIDENDMVSDSDMCICTQQSIKAYVDTLVGFAAPNFTWFTLNFGGPIPNQPVTVLRNKIGDNHLLYIPGVLSTGNNTGDADIVSVESIPLPYPTTDVCGGIVVSSDGCEMAGVFKIGTTGHVTISMSSTLDNRVFTGNISSNSVNASGFKTFTARFWL